MQVAPRLVQIPAQLRLRNVAHAVRASYSNLAKLVSGSPQKKFLGFRQTPGDPPLPHPPPGVPRLPQREASVGSEDPSPGTPGSSDTSS